MQKYFRTVPMYFWVFTIWCISKVFQYILNQEYTVWETIWKRSLEFFDEDEYKLFVNGILMNSTAACIFAIGTFTIFDFTLKPKFIRKYKINPNTNEPPDFKKALKSIIYAILTGMFLAKPTFIVMYYGCLWRGFPSIYTLPNIYTVIISCFVSDHLFDVANYIIHRSLHHRFLYKHFHKVHHEYTSTIALVVLHSQALEHLVLNILPLVVGPIILGCHIATTWVYVFTFIVYSTIAHSGYHLPLLISSEFHDFHHVRFNTNYSVLGLMDWIFGTDKAFKNTVYEKRDRLLLSFKSARELYPNEEEINFKNN